MIDQSLTKSHGSGSSMLGSKVGLRYHRPNLKTSYGKEHITDFKPAIWDLPELKTGQPKILSIILAVRNWLITRLSSTSSIWLIFLR